MEKHKLEQIQLLYNIVQKLNGDNDSEENISDALQKICEMFKFEAAFIYECDHTGQLFLRENKIVVHDISLPEVLYPDEYLKSEQIAELCKFPLQYGGSDSIKNNLVNGLCKMLFLSSLCTLFIVDDSDTIIGCVGIAERGQFSMSEADIKMAETVLKLIAERCRLRVYKQRLGFTSATLENIMDNTGFDIYVTDFYTNEILYANRTMAAPYGGWENMRGKTCHVALYNGQAETCSYCPKHRLIDENGNPTKTYAWDSLLKNPQCVAMN